jgi:hypothetical protein
LADLEGEGGDWVSVEGEEHRLLRGDRTEQCDEDEGSERKRMLTKGAEGETPRHRDRNEDGNRHLTRMYQMLADDEAREAAKGHLTRCVQPA